MIPYFQIEEIKFGPIHLQAWGLLVSLGFLAAILWGIKEAKKKNISTDIILNLAIISFFSSMIGARLLFVLLFIKDFTSNPLEVFKFWHGGLVYYGGFILAILCCILYIRYKKINLKILADILAPGIALGYGIGRIGCFFIHDHIGKITSMPWGINYFGEVRHDTGLYGSLSGFILFFILVFLSKKKFLPSGGLFLFFLGGYAFSRFIIDFFRADDLAIVDPRFLGLTLSQYISLIIIVLTFILGYNLKRLKNNF